MFEHQQVVFFVDDDPQLRQANSQSIELAGLEVETFETGEGALRRIGRDFPGVVVSDIRMPRMDGLQLFERIREIDPDIPVILITGHADVPMAVNALRQGAFDFLPKPFATDHLIATIQRALETRRLVLDNRDLRAAISEGDSPLLGDSPAMVRLRETIVQVAKADIDVLIEGETGTGKELVALMLHRQGPRRGRPFIAVNCGSLPEAIAENELFGLSRGTSGGRSDRVGRIEASHNGTLFLDEIDSMDLTVQTQLLRVAEEREVVPIGADEPRVINLRIIAAAKEDLKEAIAHGRFREDLYYRLNVVNLRLPPLRERRSDIPQLFAYFVDVASEQLGIGEFEMTDGVRRRLIDHDWPGNVRELRNFAFNAVLGLPETDSGAAAQPILPLAKRVERFESSAICDAMRAAQGDISKVMELLGVPRKTLYDKLARHGIDPKQFRV